VAVRDAVGARKRVLGEHGGEVEVIEAGVVIGQVVLIPVQGVHVKRPGLQGLGPIAAKQTGAPLQHRTRVQAEGGHGHTLGQTGLAAVAINPAVIVFILVLPRLQHQLGRQVPIGHQDGPRQLVVQHDAGGIRLIAISAAWVVSAIGGAVHRESGQLTGQVPIEAAGQIGTQIVGIELRHAVKRRGNRGRGIGVLHGLPLQDTDASGECAAGPGHVGRVGQDALRQRVAGGRSEVPPVVVVADPVHREAKSNRLTQVAPTHMAVAEAPAGLVAQIVHRHQLQARSALERRQGQGPLHVPEFVAEFHAALGHGRGRDGQVAIRGQVQVVGQAHFHPAQAVHAKHRRQKPRLALLGQWKADAGRRQNRRA
jgi:hypothetical protein